MARLDVRMDARWAGATEDYTSEAVLVAVSVTDHDGAPVTGLLRGAFRARYQFDPESSVPAGLYDFREILQNPNVRGIYTFLLAPGGENPGQLDQDELFVFLSVSDAGNRGQSLCMARYHRIQSTGSE